MDMGVAGKVAIVTGATSNIGRAIALAFAGEGARVVVVGRDGAAGQSLVDLSLERGASGAIFAAIDLLDADAGDRVAKTALESFGAIDILVNNVGGNTAIAPFAESDPATWQADIDISLMTTLRCTRAVVPHMIARKSGRIINIGSTAGDVGDHLLAVYSAAKGAVHTFTRALAKEVGPYDVTVNCVAPYATYPESAEDMSSGSRFLPGSGFFATALTGVGAEDRRRMKRACALPRGAAKASEVAAAVLYLASASAAFVTGQIHFVDGGARL